MLKRIIAALLVVLSIGMQGCVSVGVTGLQGYVNSYNGYEFLYPTGWVQVKVSNGPDVVFHDIIQETENVSVVINDIGDNKTLQELGTPTEVGQRLAKNVISSTDANRVAELISAETREIGDETYYILEYAVTLPNQQRHNLASVIVRRGQLYSLNVSTLESRWPKMQETFRSVVNSFRVY
jgi:photosystem II oxygen-evolving enhancer protein 2